MNSGSLGNRSARQPKQSSNANQPALSIRPRTKVGAQQPGSSNQCTNGICQLSWKPSQTDLKLPDSPGA
ncbi:MAG TPA: hypothetical protein V6C89_11485 [Drouetiella sp.]|jgi:hypothetical protein